MPGRFRLVDLAVTAAGCERIAEYRVTRSIESRRSQEIVFSATEAADATAKTKHIPRVAPSAVASLSRLSPVRSRTRHRADFSSDRETSASRASRAFARHLDHWINPPFGAGLEDHRLPAVLSRMVQARSARVPSLRYHMPSGPRTKLRSRSMLPIGPSPRRPLTSTRNLKRASISVFPALFSAWNSST